MAVFLTRCRAVFAECVRHVSSPDANMESYVYVSTRLRRLELALTRAMGSLITQEAGEQLIQLIKTLQVEAEAMIPRNAEGTAYKAKRVKPPGQSGAPQYIITRAQVEFLAECGFTHGEMGEILGVSKSTVSRRMRDFECVPSKQYANLSDVELDHEVSMAAGGNKQLGANSIQARLLGQGLKVQRCRIRESMVRVDPASVAQRAMSQRLHRRSYTVPGPNSLWHIDGNHKLIRWRIVIHGGIDGYSRMVVFLGASNNNKAPTVLNLFSHAITVYGVPSRVRCDEGGENNSVCLFMDTFRGPNRGSSIRGSSVHNQRIERLWRDLWNGACNFYHNLFTFMENENILSVDNDTHIWVLHFIFLPRINDALKTFTSQWNNHKLRTEGHQSPLQLFVRKVLGLKYSNLTAVKDMFAKYHQSHSQADSDPCLDNFNIEWTEELKVPPTKCPLSQDNLLLVKETVDPLQPVDDHGISLFKATLQLCEHL